MQNRIAITATTADLEDQSEMLPPLVILQCADNVLEMLPPEVCIQTSFEIENAAENKVKTITNIAFPANEAMFPLVPPMPPTKSGLIKKKLTEKDRKLAILEKKITELPWNVKEKSLCQHARDTSFERNKSAVHQFRRDIFMMHTAMQSPGYDVHGKYNYHGSLASSILKKLHYMIRHYGAIYKREKKWTRFSDTHNIPLASILLHTGRLLIQLPQIEDGKDFSAEFFTEFLGVTNVNRRHAATHGIILEPKPIKTKLGIWKHLKESKPGLAEVVYEVGKSYFVDNGLKGHYGINLALGGFGNKHYLSQNVIDNKGANGHLYMYYLPATLDTPGGLLIGIEQSAPLDCAPEISDGLGRVFDNCGGGHTMLGGTNTYSATGGTPWAREDKLHNNHEQYTGLKEHGPDEYYDAMFMHMSSEQLQHMLENYNEANFDPTWLVDSPNGHYKLDTLGHDRLNKLYEQKNNALDSELPAKTVVRLPYSTERDVLKSGNSGSYSVLNGFWSQRSAECVHIPRRKFRSSSRKPEEKMTGVEFLGCNDDTLMFLSRPSGSNACLGQLDKMHQKK